MAPATGGKLGHHRIVRTSRLTNTARLALILALLPALGGCGRKGDPIPRVRAAPAACSIRWAAFRVLEVRLPTQDARGDRLVGVEKLRVFYLPLGAVRPSAQEVLARGEVVLERSRPDLPGPGGVLKMDMRQIGRPAGWIVVAALRVGNVIGAPTEPMAWLDPLIG